jgi:hypothetical protein
MWRIGKNWPTDEPSARSFIANDLEQAFSAGYNIVVDAVALGRGSWTILSDEARKNVAKINDGGSSLTVRYNVPGERKPVECIYEKLPVDYSLPFIGAGILRFRRWPARLLAFEFAVITGWSAGPDR